MDSWTRPYRRAPCHPSTPKEYRIETTVHPVDERLPLGRLTALGLQHVLVMYAGAVAVPLIVGGHSTSRRTR